MHLLHRLLLLVVAVALVLLLVTTISVLLLVRWLVITEPIHLRHERILIVVRLLRLLGLLPSIVLLRQFAELRSRSAVRRAHSLISILVLALFQVSVAHGTTTTAEARLGLLTLHKIKRTLMSLVGSLHARGHSKLLLRRAINVSSGRYSLVLIRLLAREARILSLMRATERSRSIVRAASLE